MSNEESKQVATQSGGAVALPSAALAKMSKAKHVDTFKPGELMLPWLQIVQSSSGYMKRGNPNFVQGAAEGDIIDSVSRKVRAAQTIILVKFETHYTTFKPKAGPLVKQWFTDPTGYNAASFPEGKDYGTKIDGDGNEVQVGPMYYVLMVDLKTGRCDPASMSWGSTQAKKTRRLNTLAREDLIGEDGLPFTPPLYARLFDITTTIENGKGDNADKTFGGWVAEVGDLVLSVPKFGDMWYAKAEAFRDQIDAGNVRPLPPAENEEATQRDDEDRPRRRRGEGPVTDVDGKLDDDVPF